MFFIFVAGWSPVYLYVCTVAVPDFHSTITSALIMAAELSLLSNIIELFLYNHELRRHLSRKVCRWQ